jgi:SAM-dependent methyltransferase
MIPGIEGLPPRAAVRLLVNLHAASHAVRAMAVLGLADYLRDGPRTAQELAEATGTHAPTLTRFLRTLAAIGLCSHEEEGRIRLTAMGDLLCEDVPGSMRSYALAIAAPYAMRAWDELPEAVRTGDSTFPHVHGLGFWDYLSAHPEDGNHFDGAMSGAVVTRAEALLAARDLSAIGTLVDVGGGQGRLLVAALEAAPGLRAVLFDRPEVLAGAEATLAAAGLRDRCELVGGDFFDAVPAGGDAYVLSQILHDWPDAEAEAILRTCHRAMAPGARLWLLEQVVPPGDAFDAVKLLDLLMLVNFGGQERTAEEYRLLLEGVGFQDMTVLSTPTTWNVIEAVRS